jgi:heme-degrading monooxygenase HmoA
MGFAFMVLHYPEQGNQEQLARNMNEFGAMLEGADGLVSVGAWYDEDRDCLVGLSTWESRESFDAFGIKPAGSDVPEGERAPRERYFLRRV